MIQTVCLPPLTPAEPGPTDAGLICSRTCGHVTRTTSLDDVSSQGSDDAEFSMSVVDRSGCRRARQRKVADGGESWG